MKIPKPLARVIEAFEKLPGIGPKTAQRLTYYLLHVPQSELDFFADALGNLKKQTILCSNCKNVSEVDPCPICQDSFRDSSTILVVENPLDILAFERTGKYKGLYHVLHGVLSPLNGVGPDDLKVKELVARLKDGGIREVILATNPNLE